MDKPVKYHLNEDVKSVCNSKVTYGRKGDLVTEIARSEHVIIVEGNTGRFPVNIEKLTKIN